jgi:hypothetical protein
MLMEWNGLTEQNEQVLAGLVVQTDKKDAEKHKKKRSQSDKQGINRYNQSLLKQILATQKVILENQRWERRYREHLGHATYTREEVERFSVMDEVDKEIVQRLLEVGVDGALPKDVAAEVNKRGGFSLRYYEVSRRLVRLNKKLDFETEKVLFEKRGHRWALSRFGFEVYGNAIEEGVSAKASVEELGEL